MWRYYKNSGILIRCFRTCQYKYHCIKVQAAGLKLLVILFLLFPVNVDKIFNWPQWENVCMTFSVCAGLFPSRHTKNVVAYALFNGHQSYYYSIYQWPKVQLIKISAFFFLSQSPFKHGRLSSNFSRSLDSLKCARFHHSSSFTSITQQT